MTTREHKAAIEAAEIIGTDPSWLPRVLATLKRDFPKQLNDALCTSVSENARRNVTEELSEALATASAANNKGTPIDPRTWQPYR